MHANIKNYVQTFALFKIHEYSNSSKQLMSFQVFCLEKGAALINVSTSKWCWWITDDPQIWLETQEISNWLKEKYNRSINICIVYIFDAGIRVKRIML